MKYLILVVLMMGIGTAAMAGSCDIPFTAEYLEVRDASIGKPQFSDSDCLRDLCGPRGCSQAKFLNVVDSPNSPLDLTSYGQPGKVGWLINCSCSK